MEVIYIDSLFLLNLVIDYVLTVMCAQVCGVRLRRRRYAFAALAGAVYAVAVYLPGLGWLKSAPFRLAAGALMALIAFAGEERPMRCAVVFFAVAAAFGGFIWAIALAGGYPAFDMRTLVAAFALCYALLRIVFSRRVKLADQARVQVSLTLGARRSEFVALVDTGNSLTDPISGGAVIVVCPHALRPLFPGLEPLLDLDAVEFLSAASELPEFCGRLRLIPYTSAFKPERLTVDGKAREALVAISPNACGDGYDGII